MTLKERAARAAMEHGQEHNGWEPLRYFPPDSTGQGGYLVNDNGDVEARGFLNRTGAEHWATYYGYRIVPTSPDTPTLDPRD